MAISVGEIVKDSWNWMLFVLFKPFRFKKWLVLVLVAFLAGEFGGANSSGGGGSPILQEEEANAAQVEEFGDEAGLGDEAGVGEETLVADEGTIADAPAADLDQTEAQFVHPAGAGPEPLSAFETLFERFGRLLVMGVIALGVFVILFFMWLGARFQFILLDDVAKNGAEIRQPFRENRAQGNSLFLWNLAVGVLLILVFVGLYRWALTSFGVALPAGEAGDQNIMEIMGLILPVVLVGAGVLILFGILGLFVKDFLLPVMSKRRVRILAAWRVFPSLFRTQWGAVVRYFLYKLGLAIVWMIATLITTLALVVVVGVPLFVIFFLGFLVHSALPGVLQIVLVTVGTLFAILIGIGLYFLVLCVSLLAVVFFRTFSLKFVARINPEFNLFPARGEVGG